MKLYIKLYVLLPCRCTHFHILTLPQINVNFLFDGGFLVSNVLLMKLHDCIYIRWSHSPCAYLYFFVISWFGSFFFCSNYKWMSFKVWCVILPLQVFNKLWLVPFNLTVLQLKMHQTKLYRSKNMLCQRACKCAHLILLLQICRNAIRNQKWNITQRQSS